MTTPESIASDVESGVTVAERYRVFEKLGDGGFAAVWRARDEVTGRDVALKFLFANARTEGYRLTMFEREAEALQRLDHPAIGRAHGSGRDGRRMYIVLELIQGQTLHHVTMARWRAREQLALTEVASWLDTILDALSYAHGAGLVHRDLKPANIMVTGGVPPVRLLDFGVAKLLDGGDTDSATTLGRIIGTPSYLSPEQVAHGRVTAQSDLFALGSLMFELVTGRKLWIRDSDDRPVDVFGIGAARKDVVRNGPPGMCRRLMFEPRPRLRDYRPEAPEGLERLCLSLLDPLAAKRPASALEARVQLAHALDLPLPPSVRTAYEAAMRRAAERTASQLRPDPDATPVAPWAQAARLPADRSSAIDVAVARAGTAEPVRAEAQLRPVAAARPQRPASPAPAASPRLEATAPIAPDAVIMHPAVVAPARALVMPGSVALDSSGLSAAPVVLPQEAPPLPSAFGPLEQAAFVGTGLGIGLAVHDTRIGAGVLAFSGGLAAAGWAWRQRRQRPTLQLLTALEQHPGCEWKRVETRGDSTVYSGSLLKPAAGATGVVELAMPRRQLIPVRYRFRVEAALMRDPSPLFSRTETPLDWAHLTALMVAEPSAHQEQLHKLLMAASRRAVQGRIVARTLRLELCLKRGTTRERLEELWDAACVALVTARWLDRESVRVRAWSEAQDG
jgi:serine/threonine protein kinase